MGKTYTKDELFTELSKALKEKGIDNFYTNKAINWIGCIKGTDKPYSEEIIEFMYADENNLITSDKKINGITPLNRECYYTLSHETLTSDTNENSNRDEEKYVKELFKSNPFENKIGCPIDFQVPLKSCLSDKAGKIDFLTYKKADEKHLQDALYIVEVKKKGSGETALRCCLEAQTYLQKIKNIQDFKKDFCENKDILKDVKPENLDIKLAVIVFEDSVAGREFRAAESGDINRKRLNDLVRDFDITVCYAK